MERNAFRVEGGHKLSGEIIPQGAKNEALQVLCATMLTDQPVILENLPRILDVHNLMDLMTGLGCEIEEQSTHTFRFHTPSINVDYFRSKEYQDKASRIRGSVMLIGPMLHRVGKAFLPKPGGDKIGRRRLDTHFHGFEKLGAEFVYDADEDEFFVSAEKGMKGAFMLMDEISVTGTANMVMTAVLTPGTTKIYNAACEPYLQQLCAMVESMGAKIEGQGSNLLTIHGVDRLGGCTHRLLPDMIEIGSWVGLAAMTQSELTIKAARPEKLGVILPTFRKMGITINERDNGDIHIPAQEHYEVSTFIDGSILTVYDSPWPGFTPDLLSILLVVATQARGSVLIHQKMFESRLFFVDKLIDMGAKIILCDPHRATVIGIDRSYPLRGTNMSSPDIRAGVSLLIAACSAQGVSTISNAHQIDRGYQFIEERLKKIGVQIERL